MTYVRTKQISRCLVLNLDQTLVNTFEDGYSYYEIKESLTPQLQRRLYSFRLDNELYWGIKRPYLDDFLNFYQNNVVKVGIWSAGVKEYVEKVVGFVFETKPDFILTRDDCEFVTDYSSKERMFKPFTKLYARYPNLITRYNTWMIDERDDVAVNNIMNHI